ncbi:MAG: GNAT family N-acetyltransferase [Bacteroidia bacterium]
MEPRFHISFIEESDYAACLDIYAPYIRDTVITFEYEVPTMEEFSERIRSITQKYPWLVCRYEGKVVGYAYASSYRDRIAYQWSVESAIYIHPDFHRKGIARRLYETLLAILRLQGFLTVYAIVGYPNEQSVGFHESMGFEAFALFKKSGYKHGQWRDTLWLQYRLSEYPMDPKNPVEIGTIQGTNLVLTLEGNF